MPRRRVRCDERACALPRVLSEHVQALLRAELQQPEAAGVARLVKAWRSVRTPAQQAGLVVHLAALLGLTARVLLLPRAAASAAATNDRNAIRDASGPSGPSHAELAVTPFSGLAVVPQLRCGIRAACDRFRTTSARF